MKHLEFVVLDKLIRLHAHSPTAVNEIYKIAITADDCKDVVGAHERAADRVIDNSEVRTKGLIDTELARLIEASPQLRAAFLSQPRLSEIEPATLAVLASIADVRPNDRGVPVTRDSSFAYIAALVLDEAGTTTSDRLMQAFVRRLVAANAKFPLLISALRDAATKEDYRDLVTEFDHWLDQLALAVAPPRPPSKDIDWLISACGDALYGQADRGLLYELPRLSQIPAEFMQSFPAQQLPDAETVAGPGTASLFQRARQTQNVFDAMLAGSSAELERTVQIRLDAAKEFLTRRQFVKAQMLEFGWPQLAARARTASDMRRLRNLEKAVLEPGRQYNFSPYWRRLLADERLVDFLSIPPYFSDIPAEEFAGIAEEFAGISDTEESATASEPGTSAPDGDRVEFSGYKDIEFIFNPLPGMEAARPGHVHTKFEFKARDKREGAAIEIPVVRIRELLDVLERAYRVSYRQDEGPYLSVSQPARVIADSFPSPDGVLEDLGNLLWSALMAIAETEPVRRLFSSVITDDTEDTDKEYSLRLIFTNNDQALGDIPWECLYIPDIRASAGLTLRTSVLRNIPDPVSLVRRPMGRPLRMLIVSSTPADLPWINAEQEVTLLRRALSPAEGTGLVRLEVLQDPDEEELQNRLRVVRPHIFHFIGHGAVQPDGEGVVALSDENKRAVFVTANRFGTILRDYGILLSTLNSCFSGGTDFDTGRSIARILVEQGVPAAIATTRAVIDRTALQFAREFYTALVDGYPIEAAVVEARKLLSVKGWDWSAYVLYASVGSPLLEFRVSPPG